MTLHSHVRARGLNPRIDHGSAVHILPINALTRAGFFNQLGSSNASPTAAIVRVDGMTFSCRYDRALECFTITAGQSAYALQFVVAVTVSTIGRRYFVCDCCGQSREYLVYDEGRLLCASRYVTEGTGPSKAMRAARFKVARDTLAPRMTPAITRVCDPVSQLPAIPSEAIDEALMRATNFSTAKAINRGRGASQFEHFHAASRKSQDYFASIETAPNFVRPKHVSLTDDHPILDINIFRGQMVETKLTGRTLCWGERAEVHDEVLFFVNWKDSFPIVIAVHDPFTLSPRWQRLPLTRQVNGRFRFICPVREMGCQILYLRGGLFASREAQRLYHPSQRVNDKNK